MQIVHEFGFIAINKDLVCVVLIVSIFRHTYDRKKRALTDFTSLNLKDKLVLANTVVPKFSQLILTDEDDYTAPSP